jgi:hypothetical protein
LRRSFVALLMLAIPTTASAAVMQPGGRPQGYADDIEYWQDVGIDWLENWQGEVLASESTPFEIRVFSEEAGRDVWASGELVHEVVRETGTGHLSFHYRVDVTSGSRDTRDFEGITIRGFDRYRTDVWADVDLSDLPTMHRDSNGDSIWYIAGEGDAHWVIVRTNAPDFAPGGEFIYAVDWDGWGEDGSAHIPTYRAVPEPAAGLAALTAAAAMSLRRRAASTVLPPGVRH